MHGDTTVMAFAGERTSEIEVGDISVIGGDQPIPPAFATRGWCRDDGHKGLKRAVALLPLSRLHSWSGETDGEHSIDVREFRRMINANRNPYAYLPFASDAFGVVRLAVNRLERSGNRERELCKAPG